MSRLITSQTEIPSAYAYVCSNDSFIDSFMSYWGKSNNRINTVIVVCDNEKDVSDCLYHMNGRTDQKRVRVCYNKPRLNNSNHTYSLFDDRDSFGVCRNEENNNA